MPTSSSHIAFLRTGSGPPLLLVHGCPATHTLWEPLQERLSELRTVIAVDLPGYGASACPDHLDGFRLERIADRMFAFMAEQGFDSFDLAGHSYGCAIVATMAGMHPERVRRLVLITPMTDLVPPMARLARVAPVAAFADILWRIAPGAVRRLFIDRGLRLNYGKQVPPSRAQQISGELDRPDTVRTITRTLRAVDYERYGNTMEGLNAKALPPVLLIGSGKDRVVPPAHQRRLALQLTRAVQVFYEDGIHVVMWQRPDDVADEIRSFLKL